MMPRRDNTEIPVKDSNMFKIFEVLRHAKMDMHKMHVHTLSVAKKLTHYI